MFVPTDLHRHYITKEELMDQANERPVRWLGPSLSTDDEVLRGAIGFLKVDNGLSVHYSNAEDLHDLKIESECGPRISVSIFLEGEVSASVGRYRIPMPTYDDKSHHWSPIMTVFAQTGTETFVRQARRGTRLKKVTLSISHEWLFSQFGSGDPSFVAFKDFAEEHLANLSWIPSTHAIGLAEQIIAAPRKSSFQHRLYITARVYGLLEEAFQHLTENRTQVAVGAPASQDRQKLLAIETYLGQQRGHWVTADALSKAAGMSANTLQRLLTRTYGLSTSRFIRRFMLERSREALERDAVTISEAAYIAGYSSPANFSTAFKREFGLSPKKVT